MEPVFDEEERLRLYLLGLLPPPEQNRVEEWLLAAPNHFERMLLVEEELIDSYVCDDLLSNERAQFENYFLSAPEQRVKLRLAKALTRQATTKNSFAESRRQAAVVTKEGRLPRASTGWRWLFAPAWAIPVVAVILLCVGVGAWWMFFRQSELGAAQVALRSAYSDWRSHEARITGFDYAQLDQTREAAASDPNYTAREHAEILIRSLERKNPTSAALHLLGRLYLANKEYDKAVEKLQAAQAGDPNNAHIYNDLGAAMLEKAKRVPASDISGERFLMAGQSLEYLNKALELGDSLTDSLFNRALCFELLKNFPRAKEDWENYLKKDSGSPWSVEARRHLAKLTQQVHKTAPTREHLRDVLEQAMRGGDDDEAWLALSSGRSPVGNSVVEQLTEEALTFSARNDAMSFGGSIRLLKQAGDLELRMVGDRFTAELAHYLEVASPDQQGASARALNLLRLGNQRRTKSVDEADKLYREARQIFSRAGNECGAAITDLYSGKNLIWASKLDEALDILQRLSQFAEEREFLWLQSQAFAQLGSVHLSRNKFSEALDDALQSLKVAEKISDSNAQADNLVTIAYVHRFLGDYRVALGYLEKYALLTSGPPLSLQVSWRNCQETSSNFAAIDLHSAALEYQKDALRLAEELQVPVIKANAYVSLGWLYGKLGKFDEGIASINKAIEIGEGNQNDPVGQGIIAYSALRLGNLYRLMGQFEKALASYDQQLALANQMNAPFYSYGAHQSRFLAYAGQNNVGRALDELRAALDIFEKYRAEIVQESIKNNLFDSAQETYDAAIRFAYSSLDDPRLAFEYSEISRARSLLDVIAKPAMRALPFTEIQSHLPNDVQIVQYAVLNDALIIWVITPDNLPGEIKHVQQEISASVLANKVNQYLQLVSNIPQPSQATPTREAEELYDILIKPVRHLLKGGRQICFIPDKMLCYLPLGALLSAENHQYLLEEFVISEAPSASTFVAYTEAARAKSVTGKESLLSVGNPDFDQMRFPKLDPLPSAEAEAQEVARYYYPEALVMSGPAATEAGVKVAMLKANVIHIAAHGLIDERSALNSSLVLAADSANEQYGANSENDGVLHAYEIYSIPRLRARLVVLSACRSGVETFHRGEGMVGLARPFLIAGVPLVVSSLWKVDSGATRELMARFHKYRKQEAFPTAQALRLAQRELLRGGELGYQHPFYWAAFTVVGGYAKA